MKSITELPNDVFSQGGGKSKVHENVDEVTIRFVGDSGDGMQLTGSQFTSTTAVVGNDLSTLPDFPAEIRAPAGTLAGVSGFQIHFSSKDIHTPGDRPEVLVAMNPAALKANLEDVVDGGVLIINEDAFTDGNISKAGYEENPLTNGSLGNYRVVTIGISSLTKKALEEAPISDKDKDRCKNMFALGLTYWMFDRPLDTTEKWLRQKFAKKEAIADANVATMKAGYNFGETTEILPVHFTVKKAELKPGTYRNITGNEAISMGILAAGELAQTDVFLATYPITPASEILHFVTKHPQYRIKTFQAEDEIAAACAAIGASFAGSMGITTSSGPGIALKSEAINLAVMVELPMVIMNIQRGGPSTGLPTKTEQTDLLFSVFGRNGESPMPVIAANSPADCFYKAIEAFRLATKYMTPVMVLSETFLANGSEPWRLPDEKELAKIEVKYRTDAEDYSPYMRDKETLARPWVKPGTPGLEHRVGGLEKQDITGNVSYNPENHQHMTNVRAQKVANIANDIPKLEVWGEGDSDTLLVGWGSTKGAITDAREKLAEAGTNCHQIHIDYINPLPKNTEEILKKYKKIFVVELNTGQLAFILQGNFAIEVNKVNRVNGQPFHVSDIIAQIKQGL